MTWVSWRLQRAETAIAMGILLLVAALLVPTGIKIAHVYGQDGLGACLALNPSPACSARIDEFQQRFQSLGNLLNWFTLLPGLIGVLLAAPFIRELEHGTYRLAWTQSITRGRWLAGKLGLAVAGAVVAAGALILLVTWWRTPYVHLNGRLDTGVYDAEGTVAIGYTLFALGVALAIGAVWRRTAAALTLGFVGYFVMRVFVDTWLRDHLVTPLHATWKGAQQPAVLARSRILTQDVVGHPASVAHPHILGGHSQIAVPGDIAHTVFHVAYLPPSDFWPLQLAETGLYVAVAAALIAFAAWWTHQRAA